MCILTLIGCGLISLTASADSSCPWPDEFVCGDGTCINYEDTCDGFHQCVDESDERESYCCKCRLNVSGQTWGNWNLESVGHKVLLQHFCRLEISQLGGNGKSVAIISFLGECCLNIWQTWNVYLYLFNFFGGVADGAGWKVITKIQQNIYEISDFFFLINGTVLFQIGHLACDS